MTGAALSWVFCYLQLTAFLIVMVPEELSVLLGRQGAQQVSLGYHCLPTNPTLTGSRLWEGRAGSVGAT